MGAIKILAADTWFSKCVREAAEWKCERCGGQYEEGTTGLHCAHYHSRGHWGVRFEPLNVASLCYGCHSYIDRNPLEKIQWFDKFHSNYEIMDILLEKKENTKHGLKKYKKEIAAHYKAEFTRLKSLRSSGSTGKLAVIGYA